MTQTHILPFPPSTSLSQVVGIGLPSAFILVHYFATGDRSDLIQALLSLSLAVLLTGIINDTIKVCAGRYTVKQLIFPSWTFNCSMIFHRPRPDFYYRCFPDGQVTLDLICLGDDDTVEEGRKSFPSGHTGCEIKWEGGWQDVDVCILQGHSAVLGSWLSIWVVNSRYSVPLAVARPGGSVSSWHPSSRHAQPHWLASRTTSTTGKVCHTHTLLKKRKFVVVFPIHTSSDVAVGGTIGKPLSIMCPVRQFALFPLGLLVASLCYLQYYPSPLNNQCDSPLVSPYPARGPTHRTRKYNLSTAEEYV